MDKYSERQIKGALENAELNGFPEPTIQECKEFLDWYLSAKTEYSSVEEAMSAAHRKVLTNGIEQQISTWQDIFAKRVR
jgi:hypothetical protein